jgi:UDP-3-O-[3-hydroxymyristoyl] glucosamine N-acyltransferase
VTCAPAAVVNLRAWDIARYLGLPLQGQDIPVLGPSSVPSATAGSIVFVKRFSEATASHLNDIREVVVIATTEFEGVLRTPFLATARPRYEFARVLRRFFRPPAPSGVAATAVIDPDVVIPTDVAIGHFCRIGTGAVIGRGTILDDHVCVSGNTRIGECCHVGAHSVLGHSGFGFEFEPDGVPIRIPHLGGVVLGSHVELGAHNTVARGTLDDTVLEDSVKTDDHVHIAHNVRIGRRTIITAAVEISGSVTVGSDVWLGPNASINNGVRIAERALVSIGAVVTRDVEAAVVVAGNPARVVGPRT